MAKLKKFAAACTAAAMCAAMTGCSDTSYVISTNDDKVNAGVYIYNMISEMSYQMTMMYYMNGVTEDYFNQQVEGQDFADYMSDYALKTTKEYLAVVKQFDELGLKLTDDEKSDISDAVNEAWESNGDFYESEGISKASVKLAQQEAQMKTDIFNYFYDEGGVEEVKNSDIETYLNDNYIRYKQISIAKSTEEDESTATAADKESEELRDEYLAKAEGVSFEDFDTVIQEYNDYVAAQTAAADSSSVAETDSTAATDSTTSTADSVSDDTSSSSDDTSSASDDTSSVAESESTADSTTSSTETDSTSDSSSTDSDSSSEADKYPNETMTNYGTMDDDTKDTNSGKLATEINGLEVGVATAYEDDSNYYILIKGDVSERAAEYAEENRDSMLQEMKSDEFDEKITGWVDALDIKINDKAIKRYTPKVVYDKQEEYYSKNSAN